jgi:hypothetical protein
VNERQPGESVNSTANAKQIQAKIQSLLYEDSGQNYQKLKRLLNNCVIPDKSNYRKK